VVVPVAPPERGSDSTLQWGGTTRVGTNTELQAPKQKRDPSLAYDDPGPIPTEPQVGENFNRDIFLSFFFMLLAIVVLAIVLVIVI